MIESLLSRLQAPFLSASEIYLEQKLALACKHYKVQACAFVGGVACNKYLKARLERFCTSQGKLFFAPSPAYCTDNGAMIAYVGHYKAQQERWSDFSFRSIWPLGHNYLYTSCSAPLQRTLYWNNYTSNSFCIQTSNTRFE